MVITPVFGSSTNNLNLQGFHIEIDLGNNHDGVSKVMVPEVMVFEVEFESLISGTDNLISCTGKVSGGLQNESHKYQGSAVFSYSKV